MTSDTKRCPDCYGHGAVAPSRVDRDESGMPTRICFGRMVDCPTCQATGRVPKPPKPAPLPDRQERLMPTQTPEDAQWMDRIADALEKPDCQNILEAIREADADAPASEPEQPLNLTDRQWGLLAFVRMHWRRFGHAPTLRDMAKDAGPESHSVVLYHVRNLKTMGLLQGGEAKENRMVRLTPRAEALFGTKIPMQGIID